ncbi:YhbY family RNA-binding protein [Aquabacterium humicola]|uniref:YhbY family RNA-binding protein n=1 Tax=Aquabacterium humicola TaxID=3237377 RepID=UPI002542C053|nr:YhbY family RNA-binding protein [Rubrivivax pictus]
MPALKLTPADRKDKRGEAHHLDPVVLIGAEGLTAAVLKETDAALKAHGLIKVRMFSDDREEREAALVRLADALGAAPVQHIGKLLVLWRPLPAKEKVEREDRMAGPRTVKIVKFSKSPNHRPQVKKVKVFGNQRVTAGGSIKRAKVRTTSVKKKAQSD